MIEGQLKIVRQRPRKTLDSFVEEYSCSTFPEFENILSRIRSTSGRQLIFRGHSDHSWSLESSLERFIMRSMPGRLESGLLAECEEILIADFKRGAHLHSSEHVREDDRLGWLALMQHHGTPTRLLDWTASAYVALYFAIEPEQTKGACVWLIDLQMLEFGNFELWRRLEDSGKMKTALDYLGTLKETETPEQRALYFNALAGNAARRSIPGIVAVRPFRMHQRLTAQQGLFLVPFSSLKSFSDSMLEIVRVQSKRVFEKVRLVRVG